MRRTRSVFGQIDLSILLLYFILVGLGLMNIYAATFTETVDFTSYEKQLMWIGLSSVLGLSILIVDAKFFEGFAYPIYGFFMLLLTCVLIFGSVHKGARSWFNLGPFALQPTEFAKFATALALSKFFSEYHQKKFTSTAYFKAFSIIFLPIVLIALQPDLGSCVVFLAFYFALYRIGFPSWIMILGFFTLFLFLVTIYLQQYSWPLTSALIIDGSHVLMLLLCLIAFLAYRFSKRQKLKIPKTLFFLFLIPSLIFTMTVNYTFNNLLENRHRDRIHELLGISHDPLGVGYNVHQSKVAIGSGEFLGKGFLQGTQTKYNFVPEQRTDFIFCTIGEEWGFIGSFVVIALFVTLLTLIIQSAERQKSVFSKFYGYSVASILFFHFTINVGMTVGLVPVIGIPLPFFSYGGSSLWAFTILLFIYLKLDSEQKFILG